MYVIVYCGHEGLDRVLWAGEEGAKAACLRIRERIKDNVSQAERLPPEPRLDDYEAVEGWRVATDAWYKLKGKFWDALGPWFWENIDDPDRVCVMKEVGEWEYECCCQELGVGTGKTWLY